MPGDPFRAHRNGPKRRLRGQRRYLRRLLQRAAAFDIHPGPGMWWDLWHYHADSEGWGNWGWRLRRAHISALAKVFQTIASRSAEFSTPFQAWIFLSGADSGADATYLHTPNPNGENFPLRVPDIRFDSRAAIQVAAGLESLIPGIRVGEIIHPDPDRPTRMVRDFLAFSQGVGVPIER